MHLAADWLSGPALNLKEEPVGKYGTLMPLLNWHGAIRGEYQVATREWDSFCPIWHTGQAAKALSMAAAVLKRPELKEAGAAAAGFVVNNRTPTGALLAMEDHPDKINTSAILEALDGLFAIPEHRDAAVEILHWVKERLWDAERGLFYGLYDPVAEKVLPEEVRAGQARPLLDDAVYVTGWRLSGDPALLAVATATAERLLRDEFPAGNWMKYGPCQFPEQRIHPRHAYWWGGPMLAVYRATGDERFRECFIRSVNWYRRAMRPDGGIFRNTYADFTTDSFGHATSGAACAVIMFLEYYGETGDEEILPFIENGLKFCMSMQFTNPADTNLKGAILEKILPPDGTDRSPYHVRALGSIFFLQAAAKYSEQFALRSS